MKDRRPLSVWRILLLSVCAASLLLALANRVPRFSADGPGWVRAVPSEVTSKLLAKDFYLLRPPAPRIIVLLSVDPTRNLLEQVHTECVAPWDESLYTRPPPRV